MGAMAPIVGTGLGLTETAGFCTYIRRQSGQARDCATSLGVSMPVYPMSIREAMRSDGSAGSELREGKLGHICFRGPQTFLGYLSDPVATAATISTDGFLYTGDMGFVEAGGLHLAGRAKWVIKPGGYQVFPGDVEQHFMALDGVANCAVVGVPHAMLSEAIVAFIEPAPGAAITSAMLERHARALASYMRPRHYVLLEPGQMPLNRIAKPDHSALVERAKREF
jgi:acyl-CoA synthetase (AMP-forming)/AMP-acid ligase II